jgi:hypothetical protein
VVGDAVATEVGLEGAVAPVTLRRCRRRFCRRNSRSRRFGRRRCRRRRNGVGRFDVAAVGNLELIGVHLKDIAI